MIDEVRDPSEKSQGRSLVATGALLGALTMLPLIALAYLVEQLAGLPFFPFDLFDWFTRVLPGTIITSGIDAIMVVTRWLPVEDTGAAAKAIEQGMGLVFVILGGLLAGAFLGAMIRRSNRPGLLWGLVAGGALFLLAVAIEFHLTSWYSTNNAWSSLWMGLLLLPWGALLGYSLQRLEAPEPPAAPVTPPVDQERRRVLVQLAAGSVVLAVGATTAGWLLNNRRRYLDTTEPVPLDEAMGSGAGQPLVEQPPAATEVVPEVGLELIEPAPGTRPAITPNEEFYRIDINTRPVVIERDSWRLDVSGLFDNPRPLSLAELMAFPVVTQAATLSCISNPIGGDLIGTAEWTGLRLVDLLEELGLQPEAQELLLTGADGFYESVSFEDMMDPRTLLFYGMNGETLPVEHGFPLRVFIPNRYGMKQPKWIVSMEALGEEGPGYWVERGWDEEARPRIISIIDTIATDAVTEGFIPVGGIAYAGSRGIAEVQVRVDDGSWQPADLLTPPLSPMTWVLWRYPWQPPGSGRYSLSVRAIDGNGTVQVGEYSDPHPAGATGYHTRRVTI